MTKLIIGILIGAGTILLILEYIELEERKKAALMEKWREHGRDV